MSPVEREFSQSNPQADLVSSPVADTAYHSSHVADTVNHSLSLVSLIGSVVECWQCCVGGPYSLCDNSYRTVVFTVYYSDVTFTLKDDLVRDCQMPL